MNVSFNVKLNKDLKNLMEFQMRIYRIFATERETETERQVYDRSWACIGKGLITYILEQLFGYLFALD